MLHLFKNQNYIYLTLDSYINGALIYLFPLPQRLCFHLFVCLLNRLSTLFCYLFVLLLTDVIDMLLIKLQSMYMGELVGSAW